MYDIWCHTHNRTNPQAPCRLHVSLSKDVSEVQAVQRENEIEAITTNYLCQFVILSTRCVI